MAIDIATAQRDITKIYIAAFNRVPDSAGLAYWVDVYATKGASLDAIAQGFAGSTEYTAKYPASQTNAAYVSAIYTNVFGRTADTAGSAFWSGKLADGSLTHATMMNAMLNAAATNGSADGVRLENQTTFAVDAVLTHLDTNSATAQLATITSNTASVTTATAVSTAATATIASTEAAAAAATAAAAAAAAATAATAATAAAEAAGFTFTLTTANDVKTGGTGPDTFNSTLSDGAASGTFNLGDTLNGAGGTTDTLNISSAIVAVMSLTDVLWVNKTNIEKIVVNNNAGAGAINFTTGANFNTAFAAGGVHLTTAGGAGAITTDMGTTPFTGAATIIATSTGAGDHVITAGSGAATVTSTTLAGAQTVNGTGLTSVTLTSNGAGNQLVGNSTTTAGLTSVTVTQHGSGNQTITSTSATAVTVNVLNDGTAGNQNITTAGGDDIVNATNIGGTTNVISTGAGSDTITLFASGAATSNTITGGAGNDAITLVANAAPDKLVYAGATVATDGLDSITGFAVANDILRFIDTGAQIVGTATKGYASGLGTALGLGATALVAANVIVITDTQTQTGAGMQALIATINGGGGTDIGDGVFIISAAAGNATLWYDASAAGGDSVAIATLVGINLAALATLTTNNFEIA